MRNQRAAMASAYLDIEDSEDIDGPSLISLATGLKILGELRDFHSLTVV